MPVIHHLDCGTLCPRGAVTLGLADRSPGHLVAHCLLIEGDDGLVLVDTGFGTADCASPSRLGPTRLMLGARLDPAQTAVAQVRALGHDPVDVRHVLVTHLDLDHAGGLPDFPHARVHAHAHEVAAARARRGTASLRYRPAHLAHGPRFVEHAGRGGDTWLGLDRVQLLDVGAEVAMIPLHGHTEGHVGYAVRDAADDSGGDRWLLHAGDAYLHHDETATPPRTTRGLRTYHRINSVDETMRRANVARLAELRRDHPQVTVFCAHDATELPRAQPML